MHSIQSTLIVDAPVEICYETWCDFERFPEFLSHVLRVQKVAERGSVPEGHQEGTVWHWVIKGPFGKTYDWRAAVVLNTPNKVITWAPVDPEALEEDHVATSGSVNFLKLTPAQTLVEVKLAYSAPAPPFGELVADAFHYADHLVDQALKEFKAYVERRYATGVPPLQRTAGMEPKSTEAQVQEATGTPVTKPQVR